MVVWSAGRVPARWRPCSWHPRHGRVGAAGAVLSPAFSTHADKHGPSSIPRQRPHLSYVTAAWVLHPAATSGATAAVQQPDGNACTRMHCSCGNNLQCNLQPGNTVGTASQHTSGPPSCTAATPSPPVPPPPSAALLLARCVLLLLLRLLLRLLLCLLQRAAGQASLQLLDDGGGDVVLPRRRRCLSRFQPRGRRCRGAGVGGQRGGIERQGFRCAPSRPLRRPLEG